MPLYRAFLQTLGAVALLAMAFACRRGSGNSSASAGIVNGVAITGTLTYDRLPLLKDANGVPTGLADASGITALPARGITVRGYQQIQETLQDGSTQMVWTLVTAAVTDTSGNYTLTLAPGRPTMVEVLSAFTGGNGTINLIAEPDGINSPTPAIHRLRYALRKAADGSQPANNPAPSSVLNGNANVSFAVHLTDEWWLVDPAVSPGTNIVPGLVNALPESHYSGGPAGVGSGSRILGIGDTIATFVTAYGASTPGGTLDLHYWPGRSEPRGSYVEYGRSSALFPQAFDAVQGAYHFFGTLRGAPANDDAWDEGVIMPLLGRNALFASNFNNAFADPTHPLLPAGAALDDLSPDLAVIDGLAEAMAANLLRSPYLADTQGPAATAQNLDIRTLGGAKLGPHSAPAIRAFAWEAILMANSVASPGNATTWTLINPLAMVRFFQRANTTPTSTASGPDPYSIFTQILRLQETKSAAEPVDLATFFTDLTLSSLTPTFGIPWPRPTTGAYASFATNWGTDPNALTTPLAWIPLSMSGAAPVNGSYPNLSSGEVAYAGFTLTTDRRYTLTVTISPALDAGSSLELDLPKLPIAPVTFTGAGGTTPAMVIPAGSPTPVFHPVRIRLLNPTAIQPDVSVRVDFTPVP